MHRLICVHGLKPRRVRTEPRYPERGFAVLSAMVGAAILGFFFLMYSWSVSRTQNSILDSKKAVVAEILAVELLEFFQSLGNRGIREYLKKNPMTNSVQVADQYRLCAHVNLLDRTTGVVLNEDPIARIPEAFRGPVAPAVQPNRFYRIEVVEPANLAFRPGYCDWPLSHLYFSGEAMPLGGGNFQLQPTERFYVSVGVSWASGVGSDSLVKRKVLSAVILN